MISFDIGEIDLNKGRSDSLYIFYIVDFGIRIVK